MRLLPCGARQNVEVDIDTGDRDIFARHHQPASGAIYSLWQVAWRHGFSAARPDLYLPVRHNAHFFATALVAFTPHLAPAGQR